MPSVTIVTPDDLDETRRVLGQLARNRFGTIPPAVIVDHLLSMTEEADFAVRQAALEALIRRMGFALRDGLVVASQPDEKRLLGAYTTIRKGVNQTRERSAARPYTSSLERVSPPRGSCDCPDYLRSSLGLCKHLLVVLAHVHANDQRRARALREQETSPRAGRIARLVWDPRLPLEGELDRAKGLSWEIAAPSKDLAIDAKALRNPRPRRELLLRIRAMTTPTGRQRAVYQASPAARAIVEEEIVRANRRARGDASLVELRSRLTGLGRKLYPYQREGVLAFLRSGRLLLADDMGLGKTTQAIAACHALFRSGRVVRGLLIVPSSLKPQWLREWQETTDAPAAIVDGTPRERAKIYRSLEKGFLILSYEQLLRDAHEIAAIAPEIVVLDEAQRIKNYATKSAAYVKALEPEYRLVLTGTPMENRLDELASILDWVDDIALAPKWRLTPWYTTRESDGGRGISGARHLDTMRKRLSTSMLRRRRLEVLADLPPRTDTRVPVEMTEQQRLAHDDLAQPIAQLLSAASRRPLSQPEFLRLMQLFTQQRMISNGLGQVHFEELWPTYSVARPDPALLEGLFAPKLGELRRLVGDLIAQERKVVVFSQWRRMLRLAAWSVGDIVEAAGCRAVFFTGAERTAERTRNIVDFHDDPAARVMFLSDAGGVGLNLQRAASACINLELPWNPAVLEQRIGRIYRLGQKRRIDVYNLVNEYGIESRIAELVGAKHALFKGLFDGTTDEIRFDGASSFLARARDLVDATAPPAERSPSGPDATLTDDAIEHIEKEAEYTDEIAAPAPTIAFAENGASIASLFGALRVERTQAGGLRLEAPPEAASSLIALFEGMARLLSGGPTSPRT